MKNTNEIADAMVEGLRKAFGNTRIESQYTVDMIWKILGLIEEYRKHCELMAELELIQAKIHNLKVL